MFGLSLFEQTKITPIIELETVFDELNEIVEWITPVQSSDQLQEAIRQFEESMKRADSIFKIEKERLNNLPEGELKEKIQQFLIQNENILHTVDRYLNNAFDRWIHDGAANEMIDEASLLLKTAEKEILVMKNHEYWNEIIKS